MNPGSTVPERTPRLVFGSLNHMFLSFFFTGIDFTGHRFPHLFRGREKSNGSTLLQSPQTPKPPTPTPPPPILSPPPLAAAPPPQEAASARPCSGFTRTPSPGISSSSTTPATAPNTRHGPAAFRFWPLFAADAADAFCGEGRPPPPLPHKRWRSLRRPLKSWRSFACSFQPNWKKVKTKKKNSHKQKKQTTNTCLSDLCFAFLIIFGSPDFKRCLQSQKDPQPQLTTPPSLGFCGWTNSISHHPRHH